MLIINADDFGRSHQETDVTLQCYQEGRITSATAMVFMTDSTRAAELASESEIDIGLHLNLSQPFTGNAAPKLREYHSCVIRFISSSAFARCVYNPTLRRQFQYVYQAQFEEFTRLYNRPPSHIDGHHHTHLCSNMLLDGVIPKNEKVRRGFSFGTGEKGILNLAYRRLVDRSLARKYKVTDFFFSLQHGLREGGLSRMLELATGATVELMTHPVDPLEYEYLMSDRHVQALAKVKKGTYANI